jgi:acetyl-CoA synthetase
MTVEDATDRYDVSSVEVLIAGSEAVTETIINWAKDEFSGAAVNAAYGQTEADQVTGECEALGASRTGSIGKAIPGHEIAILDHDTLEPVEQGEVGEMAIRYEGDPVCMDEYWNKPEKTAKKIRDGWLLTEDLARQDEDGYFWFEGRVDDVIISAGYRIGPEEVEDSIAKHEAVADAGVIGVPDEERGEVPKAFVQLRAGEDPSDDFKSELQQFVKDNLAKYEYPREIEFIDEVPKTVSGKLRRHELRKMEGLVEE